MTAAQEHYLSADDLRPGVFVVLDLPWFDHPFALSSFRIRTAEQVHDLRALGLPRYRFDPERSEGVLAPTLAVPAMPSGQPGVQPPPPTAGPMQAKQARVQALHAWRAQVEQVERAFVKAAALARGLNRSLLSHPQEALRDVGQLVDQMVAVFLASPQAALHLMADQLGAEDTYFHSLNVSILSMMLAGELGLSAEQAQTLGRGAMLHDVGLLEIPDRVRRKSPELYTNAERSLRAQHVAYGVAIAQRAGLDAAATAVIAQHHECADGSGYPQGLQRAEMDELACIVAVVNAYDNLCNPLDVAQAMTPHEALSSLFAKRGGQFDARVLQTLIRCLGVYPPGTLVELSDETVGVVVAINPKKPLRPRVLVYDAQVSASEAVVLDLHEEPELGISRALRPAELSPTVLAYLHPRKRVTYFFDSTSRNKDEG
jgi:putative nucleotidyltransferase with HDIG domain